MRQQNNLGETHCDALRDALLELLELFLEPAADADALACEDSGSGPDSKEPKLRSSWKLWSSSSSSAMLELEAEVPSLPAIDDDFWRKVPGAAGLLCFRRRRFSEIDLGNSLPSPSLRPLSMAAVEVTAMIRPASVAFERGRRAIQHQVAVSLSVPCLALQSRLNLPGLPQ